MTVALLHFFIHCFEIHILLSCLWNFFLTRLLEGDFRESLAYRLVDCLPVSDHLEECSICLTQNAQEACKLPCGHAFHRNCLLSWGRANIVNQDSEDSCL